MAQHVHPPGAGSAAAAAAGHVPAAVAGDVLGTTPPSGGAAGRKVLTIHKDEDGNWSMNVLAPDRLKQARNPSASKNPRTSSFKMWRQSSLRENGGQPLGADKRSRAAGASSAAADASDSVSQASEAESTGAGQQQAPLSARRNVSAPGRSMFRSGTQPLQVRRGAKTPVHTPRGPQRHPSLHSKSNPTSDDEQEFETVRHESISADAETLRDEADEIIRQLLAERREVDQRCDELAERLSEVLKRNETLEARLSVYEEAEQHWTPDHAREEARRRDAEKTVTMLKNRNHRLEEEMRKLEAEQATTKLAHNTRLREMAARKDAKIAELEDRVAQLSGRRRAQQAPPGVARAGGRGGRGGAGAGVPLPRSLSGGSGGSAGAGGARDRTHVSHQPPHFGSFDDDDAEDYAEADDDEPLVDEEEYVGGG